MDILADPQEIVTTVDGQTTAGALEVAFKNIGAQTAIVNGIELPPGEPWNYGFVGKPYRAIAYQTNGTTLRIRYTI